MNLFTTYIKTYWITGLLIFYMAGSTALKAVADVDITIPCVIKLCTGQSCYGCGLTTAVIHLLQLDFIGAYNSNPLVFIVLPLLAFLVWRHWKKFLSEEKSRSSDYS